jgi:hypothetical protein
MSQHGAPPPPPDCRKLLERLFPNNPQAQQAVLNDPEKLAILLDVCERFRRKLYQKQSLEEVAHLLLAALFLNNPQAQQAVLNDPKKSAILFDVCERLKLGAITWEQALAELRARLGVR